MRLIYSPEAIDDIVRLKEYIGKVLKNRAAAQRIVNMISLNCKQLKQYPYSGTALSSKIACDEDLRYVICENWLAFYQVADDEVRIIRILDGRTDYLKVLFPDAQ